MCVHSVYVCVFFSLLRGILLALCSSSCQVYPKSLRHGVSSGCERVKNCRGLWLLIFCDESSRTADRTWFPIDVGLTGVGRNDVLVLVILIVRFLLRWWNIHFMGFNVRLCLILYFSQRC